MDRDEIARYELLGAEVIKNGTETTIKWGKYAIIVSNNNEEGTPEISVMYYDETRDEFDTYIEDYL